MATMEAPLTTFVDDLSSTLPQPTTSTAPNATSMRSEASLAPSSTTAATMTTERGRSGPTAPLVPSAVHAKEGGGIFKKVIRAMSRDRTHAMDHPTIDPRGISRERLAEIVVEEEEQPRGRGAAGSTGVFSAVRSPSANTARTTSSSRSRQAPAIHFGGRGGVGNVIRSPSRGRLVAGLDRTATRGIDDERTDRVGGEFETDTIKEGGSIETAEGGEIILAEGEELPSVVAAAYVKVEAARSEARGREKSVIPTGRGGRGNLRSPSRNPTERRLAEEEELKEREIEDKIRREHKGKIIVGGRGGAGNMGRAA